MPLVAGMYIGGLPSLLLSVLLALLRKTAVTTKELITVIASVCTEEERARRSTLEVQPLGKKQRHFPELDEMVRTTRPRNRTALLA